MSAALRPGVPAPGGAVEFWPLDVMVWLDSFVTLLAAGWTPVDPLWRWDTWGAGWPVVYLTRPARGPA